MEVLGGGELRGSGKEWGKLRKEAGETQKALTSQEEEESPRTVDRLVEDQAGQRTKAVQSQVRRVWHHREGKV